MVGIYAEQREVCGLAQDVPACAQQIRESDSAHASKVGVSRQMIANFESWIDPEVV